MKKVWGDDVFSDIEDILGLTKSSEISGDDDLMKRLGVNNTSNLLQQDNSILGQPMSSSLDYAKELHYWELCKKCVIGLKDFVFTVIKTYKSINNQQKLNLCTNVLITNLSLFALVSLLRIFGIRLFILRVYVTLASTLLNTAICLVGIFFIGRAIEKSGGVYSENFTENQEDAVYDDDTDDTFDFNSLNEDFSGTNTSDDFFKDFMSETDDSSKFVVNLNNSSSDSELDVKSKLQLFEAKCDTIINNRYSILKYYLDMLPSFNKSFGDLKTVDDSDDLFFIIDERCTRAINAAFSKSVDPSENTKLFKLQENAFMYRAFMTRIKGFNNLQAIQKELEVYLSADPDSRENVSVSIWQDYYDIKIYKDSSKILISLRDVLDLKETQDFVLNTDNVLPAIIGVSEGGKVYMEDLKYHESGLVAGAPRFGKTTFLEELFLCSCYV